MVVGRSALQIQIIKPIDLAASRQNITFLRALARQREGNGVWPVHVGSGRWTIEVVVPVLRNAIVDLFNLGKGRRLIKLY